MLKTILTSIDTTREKSEGIVDSNSFSIHDILMLFQDNNNNKDNSLYQHQKQYANIGANAEEAYKDGFDDTLSGIDKKDNPSFPLIPFHDFQHHQEIYRDRRGMKKSFMKSLLRDNWPRVMVDHSKRDHSKQSRGKINLRGDGWRTSQSPMIRVLREREATNLSDLMTNTNDQTRGFFYRLSRNETGQNVPNIANLEALEKFLRRPKGASRLVHFLLRG